jgi:hypothetical protein
MVGAMEYCSPEKHHEWLLALTKGAESLLRANSKDAPEVIQTLREKTQLGEVLHTCSLSAWNRPKTGKRLHLELVSTVFAGHQTVALIAIVTGRRYFTPSPAHGMTLGHGVAVARLASTLRTTL